MLHLAATLAAAAVAQNASSYIQCWGPSLYSSIPIPTFSDGVTQVVSTQEAACAVNATDEELVCWGDGSLVDNVPPGLGPVITVSGHHFILCAVTATYGVHCWGDTSSQVFLNDSAYNATDVSVGYHDLCVQHRENDTLSCYGDTTEVVNDTPTLSVIDFDVGKQAACAILANNSVMCWGAALPPGYDSLPLATDVAVGADLICVIRLDNSVPQCVHDLYSNFAFSLPSKLISATMHHVCAVSTADVITCYYHGGDNSPSGLNLETVDGISANFIGGCAIGEEATPTAEPTAEPTAAPTAMPTTELLFEQPDTCNGNFSCLECWGWSSNLSGVIGSDIPSFSGGVLAVAPGSYMSNCAIAMNSTAHCWGGGALWTSLPYVPGNLSTVSALSQGAGIVCAIETAGENTTSRCWGRHDHGQLAPDGLSVSSIRTRHSLTCVILKDNHTVQCYGLTYLNDTTVKDPPALLGPVDSIDVGGNFACAIRSNDSVVVCWGENSPNVSAFPPASVVAAASYNCHTNCQNSVCIIRKNDSSVHCSFHSPWLADDDQVDILTGGVEGTFCAHNTVTKAILCLDHKTDHIHLLSTTPPQFPLKHIRDVQPGEGYACAIGALSTSEPTAAPTVSPSQSPTISPTFPTAPPTPAPTRVPTRAPTKPPTTTKLSEGDIIAISCAIIATVGIIVGTLLCRKCRNEKVNAEEQKNLLL